MRPDRPIWVIERIIELVQMIQFDFWKKINEKETKEHKLAAETKILTCL